MTYAVRQINLTFTLGQGSFSQGGNQLQLTGNRVLFEGHSVLSPGASSAIIEIYGMTLDQMNTLTVGGTQYALVGQNSVVVQAGDDQDGLTTVFAGIIVDAFPDMSRSPDTPFIVSAIVSPGAALLAPVAPTSFSGPTPLSTVLGQVAHSAGLKFEDNGVQGTLANPYLPGTATQQIDRATTAGNVFSYVDGASNTLASWPKGGSRSGGPVLVAPSDGMIGYPLYQKNTIKIRDIYSPLVKMGGQIQVQSQLTPASGLWTVYNIDLALSSVTPDGPWEMILLALNPNAPAPQQ